MEKNKMEHYSLISNSKLSIFDVDSLSVEDLKRFDGKQNVCIYIEKQGTIAGILGQREISESLRSGRVIINNQFKYCSDDSEETAREIFGRTPMFNVLPVIVDGKLLLEWSWSIDKFYEDLVVDSGINHEPRKEHIVVSLTTHGKRLETVYLAIKSIMYQTMKADEIVLYLDEESGDRTINHEDELIEKGLRIERYKRNLRPHCKYYYAMEKYKDSLIITIDDDVLYPDGLIRDLYEKHLEYPESVIAHRAHKVTDSSGKVQKVADFGWEISSDKPEKYFCATGVGGVLYPVGDYRECFLDEEVIVKCSLNADDIWLMYQEARVRKSVFAMNPYRLRYVEHSQEEEGLTVRNDGMNENQIWLKNLENHYGRTMQELIDEWRADCCST